MGHRPEESLGLAKRKMQDHSDRQRGLDRDIRIGAPTAGFAAGRSAPGVNSPTRLMTTYVIERDRESWVLRLLGRQEPMISGPTLESAKEQALERGRQWAPQMCIDTIPIRAHEVLRDPTPCRLWAPERIVHAVRTVSRRPLERERSKWP